MTVNNSFITGQYSLVLVGNPGVGKSSILNALGGHFDTGFSRVTGLTRTLTTMDTSIEGRNIRLVDLPGIFDCRADSEHTNEHHFKILHDALEDGNPYVIFFVISPNDGRISPSDFTVMKALLDSLDESPIVGLILTKVEREDYDAIQNSDYFANVLQVLRQSNANLKFLSRKKPLILFYHEEKRYDEVDSIKIKNYILAFEPREVHTRRLVAGVLLGIFHVLVGIIGIMVGA
ncbi:hypothetical protein BGZ95_004551 [Linnemannia exigua]|uniref:G domain-containing protein n=1 Tax=Linnemannia exigua TaxID=604196 RepID=A0AAD4H900_9FUNG|nr:hypothetical protein BGZ95_004551 [Linnemannia exigua]